VPILFRFGAPNILNLVALTVNSHGRRLLCRLAWCAGISLVFPLKNIDGRLLTQRRTTCAIN
jgi:hypothetical protein